MWLESYDCTKSIWSLCLAMKRVKICPKTIFSEIQLSRSNLDQGNRNGKKCCFVLVKLNCFRRKQQKIISA